jgi:hypothetical protein
MTVTVILVAGQNPAYYRSAFFINQQALFLSHHLKIGLSQQAPQLFGRSGKLRRNIGAGSNIFI